MNTDTINEKITDLVNELFLQFQNENNILSGDLSFELTFDLDSKIEALTDTIIKAMEEQKQYN